MNLRPLCVAFAAFSAASAAMAQGQLVATPAVGLTSLVPAATFAVSGSANAPYLLLADFVAGPQLFLGVSLDLGLSPSLFVLGEGALDSAGNRTVLVQVPPQPSLAGVVAYSQVLFPTPTAPNGVYVASNGESTVLHAGAAAMVDRFDDPVAEGFVGSFDATSLGGLKGTYSTRRVQPVDAGQVLETQLSSNEVSSIAAPFFSVQPPLDPRGCRTQMVYRAADLGADGTAEVLTKVFWRAFDGSPVVLDSFDGVSIRVSHSQVVPDFAIDAWSALPVGPETGLQSTFGLNESSPLVLVRSGPYTVDPNAVVLGLDGQGVGRYLDWGIAPSFVYNGVDSLLLDVRSDPSPLANGLNGAQTYLTIQSGPLPGARNVARATQPFGVLDPDLASVGQVDSLVHDVVFEFARPVAVALSPFRSAGVGVPDYQPAILAASTPGTSSVEITYRGADDAAGTNATPFSADVNVADGRQYLQYRIRLVADVATGALPRVDTLVIPVD